MALLKQMDCCREDGLLYEQAGPALIQSFGSTREPLLAKEFLLRSFLLALLVFILMMVFTVIITIHRLPLMTHIFALRSPITSYHHCV